MIRGTYVHPKLAPHVASWISPRVGLIVSDIVNNHEVMELKKQLLATEFQKSQMSQELQEIKQQNAMILQHVTEVKQQNEELKHQNDETHLKLDYITSQNDDLSEKLIIASKDYVPPTQDETKKEFLVLLKKTS